jgi:hypothetical protein
MNAELNLNEILSQIKKLNKPDQATLLKKIAAMIQKGTTSPSAKLSEISGLGSSVWHNVNIDEYVDSERQW